jgi:hypothetical protein
MVTPLLRELAGPFPLGLARSQLSLFGVDYEPQLVSPNIVPRLLGAWDRVCRQTIASGSAEGLHSAREDYQAILLGHLKILDGYLVLLNRFAGEAPVEEFTGHFAQTRDTLQKHYDSLFPRWQALEDLEAILLERVSLPNDQLKELAAKYPPPQAWYDEADAPPATQE